MNKTKRLAGRLGVKNSPIGRLKALMERLRSKDGCPWDREQTLKSLTPFIIEEAYEVVDAIESGSMDEIKEEAGDLLFQIVFISELAREKKNFSLDDVISFSVEKMIRRHPHVFGDQKVKTSGEVLKNWDEHKKKEKKFDKGLLSGIPESFPALMRAHKVGKKASKAGFDWNDAAQIIAKVHEELDELKEALRKKNKKNIEEELGDVLFSVANVARFVEVSPENALRKTVGKFIKRFHYIEKKIEAKGKKIGEASLNEMEMLWNEAKRKEKKRRITAG